jgi:hypothetical protein
LALSRRTQKLYIIDTSKEVSLEIKAENAEYIYVVVSSPKWRAKS